MKFKEAELENLKMNPFTLIGKEWTLITAGTKDNFNTMTASWGGLGVFWGKNAATVYIRPQRYTKEFVDNNDVFTLSFYGEEYRKALNICGSVSGRDVNKTLQAGLTPVFDGDSTYFAEANMVLVCKKMYHADIDPKNFDEPSFDNKMYSQKDYHCIYIAQILKVLVKE